jgi:hypothetical protein
MNKTRRGLILILTLSFTAGLISSIVLIERHRTYRREVIESTQARLTYLTLQAARSIDGILGETKQNVDSIADHLSKGEIKHEDALKELKEKLAGNEHYFSAGLCYTPYSFKPGLKLYSKLHVKKDGHIESSPVEKTYDYTKPEHKWFTEAVASGPYWSQPFYGEAAKALLITYSVPFFNTDQSTGRRSIKGIVVISLSMEQIKRTIESLDLGPTGFGALVSQKGVYIYHPDTELVISGKTLREAARELADKDRLILSEKAERGESGILDHRSASTGLNSWMIYAPIPLTGWSLQNTFMKDDLEWDVSLIRHRLIWIAISIIIFLSSAVLFLFQIYDGDRLRLWLASSICTLLLTAGIGYIWNVSLSYDSVSGNEGILISDRATLLRVMNSYTRESLERHTEAPVFIPTGIFLETASLNTSGELSISGYIWQKYKVGMQDSIARGFTISNAYNMEIKENYRVVEKGYEVVRWYFSGKVSQNLNYSKYPLDLAKINIRVLHKELNHNVFLVPDLASYKFINPTALPGIRKGMSMPGWNMSRSSFELRKIASNTGLGLEQRLDKENFPSFHFCIIIKRIFLDAFISNLIALIIVAVILFTLLMITSRDEKLVSFMQAGSGRILNICASMFFIIAFSHIEVRRRILSEQIFYLEYFYFLIYLAILLVCINSVMYSIGAKIHLIQYKDNIVFRLFFWPFLTGLMFVVTVFTFY